MITSTNRRRMLLLSSLFVVLIIFTVFPAYAQQGTPSIADTVPAANATNVRVDAAIAATLTLPNVGFGVDEATLTSDNVFLYKTSDGPTVKVPTVNNTTGGFDAIVMTPTNLLETNTQYTVQYTSGVTDQNGNAFQPYQFSFITGTEGLPQPSDIQFSQTELSNTELDKFATVDVSPDGRLFVLGLSGTLHIWDINPNDGTLSNHQDYALGNPRLMIGMVFADNYTSSNPSIWVTHNQLAFSGADHFTSGLSKFEFNGGQFVETEYIVGLPRSRKDHLANSLEFGPDGALYMTQGSISAMGDRDNAWGQQPETLLSAAVLRIDLNLLENYLTANGEPLDVTTGVPNSNNDDLTDANNYGFGDPQLSSTNQDLSDANKFYNPQLGNLSPVTVFASGVRNAYDLTWHTNGQLYVPTNGSAGGANAPGTPNTLPPACDNRLDADINGPYTTAVPAITGIPTRNDYLFRTEENGYYGHPNPTRCEWVLNGGNPTGGTDIDEVPTYAPNVNPDRNWRGAAYNFLNNKSPNGVIEYQGNAFNGQLSGQLLVVRFSGGNDVIALKPDATTFDVPEANATTGIPGFTGLNNPLDITEDTRNGNLYVVEFGDRSGNQGNSVITLLEPIDVSGEALVQADNETYIFSGSQTTDPQDIVIRNLGTAPLITTGISITGINSANFEITSGTPGTPTLQPGESITVSVQFNPSTEGVFSAGLRVISNDPVNPIYTIGLKGLGTDGEGGTNEPSLQYVLDTFGLGIVVGDDDLSTNVINSDTTAQKNPLGPDEISQPLFERAGNGPVSVTPLATYGPAQGGVTTIVGWYDPGSPTTRNDLFTVPGSDAQTLNPAFTGTTTFTPPLDQSFGFYSVWPFFSNRVVYTEPSLNAGWAQGNLHHVRVYPYKLGNGTIVPNSYIVATEEHTSGWDYNDIVLLVENVQPADLLGGELRTENLDWVFPNNVTEVGRSHWDQYLTFQRHQLTAQNPAVHDEVTLRIHNDSTTPGDTLFITGFNFRDNVNNGPGANTATEFILINGEDASVSAANPIELDPGESYDLDVKFVYSRNTSANNEQRIAFLDILSSDAAQPTKEITLSGGWQERAEQGNEPNVQEIAEYFGFSTVIVGPGQQINNQGRIEIIGEEVLSPFWLRANNNEPVYVRQLAAYHSCCSNTAPVFMQKDINSSGTTTFFTHNGADAQTLLPRITGNSGNPAQGTLNPNGTDPFGFKLHPEWSDPLRNNVTNGPDDCSGGRDTCGHHVRFWPVRGVDGELMPNTFLMVMDYSGINYDFNDNVYLVSNIVPFEAGFDLELVGAESEDPVDVSNDLIYTYTIFNNAFVPAPDVTFDITPTGLQVESIIASQGTCNGLSCNIGEMTPEQNVTVTVTLNAQQLGQVSAVANVTATGETDTTLNSTTLTTTVQSGTPASITVVKQANPEGAQPFNFDGTGGIGAFTITDDGSSTPNDFSASINFQASGATPNGFDFSDGGDAYGDRGNGLTYGWRNVNDGQPFDGTPNARNRSNNSITPENTLMHLRYNECCADGNNGTQTPLFWEIEVPNGEYDVIVALGDSNNDSTPETIHAVTAEGVVIADGSLTPAPSGNSIPGHTGLYPVARVTVTDGALTIDQAPNGFNTKINYIIIEGVSQLNDRQTFDFLLAGDYDITETLPNGWSLDSVICEGGATSPIANGVRVSLTAGDDVVCTFANSQSGTPGSITVVKQADPESDQEFSFNGTGGIGAFTITDDGSSTPNDFSASINFQDELTVATPNGFIADDGNAYGDRGNGFTYGWRNVNDDQPFDGRINARNRGGDNDVTPANSLMHLRYNECCATQNNGTQTPLYWEIEVPNGEYDVTVALGDPSNDTTETTIHAVTAEGVVIADGSLTPALVNDEVPGHSSEYPAVRVTVTDGALTIDQAPNGFNTKINYIIVEGIPQLNDRQTFDLLAGSYDITETLPNGWSLDSVTCEGGTTSSITNGVRVSLAPGDDMVCTFANSQTGNDTAPLALADAASTTGSLPVTFSITANDEATTGRTIDNTTVDLNTATTEIDTSLSVTGEGDFSYDPQTDTMTFTPVSGFTGTSTIEYIVQDNTGEQSNPADISVEVTPSTVCDGISTLACNQLVVDYATSGYCATFDGADGFLSNTGFTMVQEPSFTTFNADPLPNPDVPGYNPALINVAGGQLQLTSTQGIAFLNPPGGTGDSSTDTNSQINTLGVGLDVSEAFVVSTIINGAGLCHQR
jgi:glucose/arabinose dehydrogenase